jgi:hypothetical protein
MEATYDKGNKRILITGAIPDDLIFVKKNGKIIFQIPVEKDGTCFVTQQDEIVGGDVIILATPEDRITITLEAE